MASIKNLEMAAALSAYKNITIKKSLFSTKAVYEPTQSIVKPVVLEYTPTSGEYLAHLLSLPLDKMADELDKKGKPATAPIGHFHLEVCLSDDHQFCALQLFRFMDFSYTPVFEPRFYEGQDVATIVKLLP